MKDEGGNVFKTLENLDQESIRVMDTLIRAAGSGDKFRTALELGNRAWKENTALTIEAQKRYDTFASKMTIYWNKVKDIGITLGEKLIPVVESLVQQAEELGKGEGFKKWAEDAQRQMEQMLLGTARHIDRLRPMISGLWEKINEAWEGWKKMPDWMKEIGLVGAMLGGTKTKIFIIALGMALEELKTQVEGVKAAWEGDIGWMDIVLSSHTELKEKLIQNKKAVGEFGGTLREVASIQPGDIGWDKLSGILIKIKDETGNAEQAMRNFIVNTWLKERVEPFIKPTGEMMVKMFKDSKEAAKALEKQVDGVKNAVAETGKKTSESFKDMKDIARGAMIEFIWTEAEKTRINLEENIKRLTISLEYYAEMEKQDSKNAAEYIGLQERITAKIEEFRQQITANEQAELDKRLNLTRDNAEKTAKILEDNAKATENAAKTASDATGDTWVSNLDKIARAAERAGAALRANVGGGEPAWNAPFKYINGRKVYAEKEPTGPSTYRWVYPSSLPPPVTGAPSPTGTGGGAPSPKDAPYPSAKDAPYPSAKEYQHGTPYVRETGLAMLHRGERIIPANQNTTTNTSNTYSVNVSVTGGPAQDWDRITRYQIIPALQKAVRRSGVRLN